MRSVLSRVMTIAALVMPAAAVAEPVTLRLAYFSSDRTQLYQACVKPFVDAVNAEAAGLLRIEVVFGGKLGADLSRQDELVREGTAAIGFAVPGLAPQRFPDNAVLELPGFYRDHMEASLAYTRLAADGRLRGHQDFVVLGTFVTEGESIHTRPRVSSLEDLKGKRIRANNALKAMALRKLGMEPVVMPVNQVSLAIGSGQIDGAAVPPAPLFDFGIGRMVTSHYFLDTGGAPLLLLMNRKAFDDLPAKAKDVVRKYSGEWAARRFAEIYGSTNRQYMRQLQEDAQRAVFIPTPTERAAAAAAFKGVAEEFAAESAANKRLLELARAEVRRLRGDGSTARRP